MIRTAIAVKHDPNASAMCLPKRRDLPEAGPVGAGEAYDKVLRAMRNQEMLFYAGSANAR